MRPDRPPLQTVTCTECEKPLTDEEIKYCNERHIPTDEMVCTKCLRGYIAEHLRHE